MEAADILVVDDCQILLAMVTDILAGEGYSVRQAENGVVALEAVSKKSPDLILLDVMMPEMDGYEVCETLRREPEYIPILMLSAKSELRDLVRGLDAGADDYISKPFQAEELVARVKTLLRIRTLQLRLYCQNLELEAKNQQLAALFQQLDAANQELKLLSVTDGLTRAYNHRHFQERLRSEFSRARRHGEPLACVMIDIDNFKRVNDLHGHPVGDRVLVRLVEILKEATRGEDLVARYGGEEFVLLLPKTDGERALHLAERLRERVEREGFLLPAGERIPFTVSLGVAGCDSAQGDCIDTSDRLLQAADAALYRAKADGRNRVVVA